MFEPIFHKAEPQTEDDKIIAYFDGYIHYHKGVDIDMVDCGGIYKKMEVFSRVPIDVEDYKDQVYLKDGWWSKNGKNFSFTLKYKTDWNVLMPVCLKAKLILQEYKQVVTEEDGELFKECIDLVSDIKAKAMGFEIEPVYEALVKFIKWHNDV